MSKTVVEYTARRVTYETSLPIGTVLERLDREINKPGGGLPLFRLLRDAKERTELEEGINALTQGRDFVYVRAPLVSRCLHADRCPLQVLRGYGVPPLDEHLLWHDKHPADVRIRPREPAHRPDHASARFVGGFAHPSEDSRHGEGRQVGNKGHL